MNHSRDEEVKCDADMVVEAKKAEYRAELLGLCGLAGVAVLLVLGVLYVQCAIFLGWPGGDYFFDKLTLVYERIALLKI